MNSTLKQFACEAKARMLREGQFPSFLGKIPYNQYELLMKVAGSNETLCKISRAIETGDELMPLTELIDMELFNSLTPSEQQRYILRFATLYRSIKQIYAEIDEKRKMEM